MQFDFDKLIERRGTHCVKWDKPMADDVIPMWVADMDFEVAPAITDALRKRVKHGVFGYVSVPDEFFQATTGWFDRRHQWHINHDWIQYTIGVVPALAVIVRALTCPGDKVMIMTPVYNCFFSAVQNNDRQLVECPLIYEDATYRIDFDEMERKMCNGEVKLLILCNPHNPACRVWTVEELKRIGDICRRNGVMVLSDEIHCEFVYPGHQYTPFASIEGHQQFTVTCVSPSKAFNIAGLQTALIVCANSEWRNRIDQVLCASEVNMLNPFGVEALIAAYNYGAAWMDALNDYIYGNYQLLHDTFASHLSHLTVTRLEGTYLAWVDCRVMGMTSEQLTQYLLDNARVMVNSGSIYGMPGEGFIRINLATQRSRVTEALNRMIPVLKG